MSELFSIFNMKIIDPSVLASANHYKLYRGNLGNNHLKYKTVRQEEKRDIVDQ